MKTLYTSLFGAILAIGLATSASAQRSGPGPFSATRSYKAAQTEKDVKALKKGDRYALVCMDCKSISVKEVADEKEVEALCHDGGTIHCDSCKKVVKVKRTGPPSHTITTSKIVYVNADGKECMMLVPLKD